MNHGDAQEMERFHMNAAGSLQAVLRLCLGARGSKLNKPTSPLKAEVGGRQKPAPMGEAGMVVLADSRPSRALYFLASSAESARCHCRRSPPVATIAHPS